MCAALVACGKAPPAAYYDAGDCRRIDLLDKATGAAIVGAEDMAIDREKGRLLISAYDRRAAERAAKRGRRPPDGGLYAVAVEKLFDANQSLSVTPMMDTAEFDNGLRPHGIAVSDGEIAFINRAYVKDGARWRLEPTLARVRPDGEKEENPVHCAANDVAYADGEIVHTRDHGACGGYGRFLETVFARKKSGAYGMDGKAVIDGVAFANGVAVADAGLAVAATREKALHMRASESPHARATVSLPDAPDNLSMDEGAIVVALHPDLFRLALNRKLGVGKAGSRIARVDLQTQEIEILFDDRSGDQFSAATVGVITARGLVAGSVTDAGVLVCEKDA